MDGVYCSGKNGFALHLRNILTKFIFQYTLTTASLYAYCRCCLIACHLLDIPRHCTFHL